MGQFNTIPPNPFPPSSEKVGDAVEIEKDITSIKEDITSLESGLTSVSGKLITVTTYYDATNQVYPVATSPATSSQITILGRNFATGAIYAMWYDSSKSGFILGHVLVGNNPSDGDAVTLQYLA